MDANVLRDLALKAIGKNPAAEVENPQFDSLDKLEIITALHDELGDAISGVDDLDNFTDLETLTNLLKAHGVIA